MKPLIGPFEAPVIHIPLPEGLPWESIPLHGFGILVATGFLMGGREAKKAAERRGLDPDVIERLIGWLVLGTFIGGHVGYGLMYAPDEYLANPIKFLYVWEGLSSYGGFAVCVPLTIWFFKREGVRVWPYVDTIAIGLTLGWFFGRMGCFVAHDHPGTPTDFWLGVYGICQPGGDPNVACHDMGLYEAIWSGSMFLLFRWMDRVPRKPGLYAAILAAAYAPVRFFMDFLRPEVTDVRYAGLTPAQYFSLIFLALGIWAIFNRLNSQAEPVWAEDESEPGDEAAAAS